jgi:hypothetical protein
MCYSFSKTPSFLLLLRSTDLNHFMLKLSPKLLDPLENLLIHWRIQQLLQILLVFLEILFPFQAFEVFMQTLDHGWFLLQ